MPVRKDINFNSGFTGCNDRMAILKNETVPRKLEDFKEIAPSEINTDMFVYVDDGNARKIRLGNIINTTASQADWDETDESSYSYIKNKPDNLVLDRDITSLFDVGGIRTGKVFEKGTSLNDIIISLLTYTEKATGILFGIVDKIPDVIYGDFIDELTVSVPDDKNYLLENGWSRSFTVNDEFYVLAVPKDLGIIVTDVIQDGLSLSFSHIPDVEELNLSNEIIKVWDIYLPTKKTYPDNNAEYAKSTGTYTVTYKFAEKENG